MFKKGKVLLVLTLLVIFALIIIANTQEVPVANSFRFPLEGDWSPLWQDFGKWNNQWNGYHLGEDVGREDVDIKNYAVYPMADGIVKFADIVMGYTVIIEHKLSNDDPDGDYVCSVYYHMKRPEEGGIKLTVGESVSIDSPIGHVSSKLEDYKSSPHLHFGIRKGRYKTGKDPRTGFWYYPGYTVIKKEGEVQKNPNDPIHKQILADWFNPSSDPKNGTGFIERHIAKIEQTTEISKTLPVITSP
ncbi:M23 family metallopeptidase, partial [bacterium]|nr:M23 family metallopeptidase [bacterium]